MSVEPSEVTSEVWTNWQGHVINGVYSLGRFLGCSDHSGVFLTTAAEHPAEVAIKLVPTNRALAECLLPRWKRAGGLAHPHLLRLSEWGGCQLDGLPYLYTVMEYADQTLAQLLLHRALTEDEAREMLLPALDALAFLHGRNLVQGQLKPSNILVVGDQLKLASDTIRRVSDTAVSGNAPTLYDPPEARYGSGSPAGDVWALGVSLFEALTRRPLSSPSGPGDAVVLPPDFSPALRDLLTRCLSRNPQDRPSVSELITWARGGAAGPAQAATIPPVTIQPPPVMIQPPPVTLVPPQPTTPEPVSQSTVPPQVVTEAARPAASAVQSSRERTLLTAVLGAVAAVALSWTGLRMLGTHRTPDPTLAPAQSPAGSPSQTPGSAAPATAELRASLPAVSTAKAGRSGVATSPAALHEVTPEVPWSARRTIRGHIRVWVRVIVDPDGSVFAADTDRTGPSSYFERVAIEAAKKWTFAPVDTQSRRTMQVRFDFSRTGTTERALTLH